MSTAYFKNSALMVFALILMTVTSGCTPEPKPALEKSQEDLLLYVGTYTDGDSEGIYVYEMNLERGKLS